MKSQGIPDFQAPPPIPKFIDTLEALDELPCYDSFEPAPDEWDRLFNVDFFIKIKDKFIGLQIKPAGYAFITQIINERKNQEATHKKFTAKYGGKVFYVISVKDGDKKKIYNTEVINELKQEIKRLLQ